MESQSIIVYRNPLEKYIWESGNIHYVFIFAIAMLLMFLVTYKLLVKITKTNSFRHPEWFMWVSGTLGVVAGIVACIFLG